MRNKLILSLGIAILTLSVLTHAAQYGTPADAEKMVKNAIAFYKANGKDKTFLEVNNPQGQFVKQDLYIFIYDMTGKCMAHGFNKALIGKDLISMRDPNGVFYVKDRIDLVKAKGKGWQDYKFSNPLTKKIEPKRAYVERVDDYVFGCGAYHQ